jgi:hypothetical protein
MDFFQNFGFLGKDLLFGAVLKFQVKTAALDLPN